MSLTAKENVRLIGRKAPAKGQRHPPLRSFFKPTFRGSWNKGNIDSHYRSARDQAGFFAGSKGFDIYVEKNTDLRGGVIASKTTSDKNHLSTGTLSFSDLKNEADYSAKSIGASYHKYGNYKNMTEDEQTKFTTPSVLHRASPYLSREMEAVRQNLSLLQEPSTSARIRHRTSPPSAVILQTRSTNSVKSSKKRGLNLKLLDNVVEALRQGHKLDAKYRDHALHGNEKIPPVVK